MKLKELNIRTQDLMRFGIIPQRQGLAVNEIYKYPPFCNFETLNEGYLTISWRETNDGIAGRFSTDEYTYEIQIDEFTFTFDGVNYNCANAAFVTYIDGKPTIELVPTKHATQVFRTVMNGIGEKVITLKLDAIIMIATNSIDKRRNLYNKLADKYLVNFGNVYKNIKTTTGIACIIISHRVPTNIQKSLYDYALEQSENK
jgi:hypothetical protein